MGGQKKVDPATAAIMREFVELTGPSGGDQSDREVEAEMEQLGVKVSHESIRQYRNGDWTKVYRSTRRKIRTYNRWKRAAASPPPSIGEHAEVVEEGMGPLGEKGGEKGGRGKT
jgi:hypothetical protein